MKKLLWFLFIFSVPFQARLVLFRWTTPFNEWTAGFLWATDIIFILLLVTSYQLPITKTDWLLIVFLAIAAISIFQATLVPVAVYRFIKLAEYVALFFVVRHRMLRHILIIWTGSCVFQALVGIGQYVFQRDLGLRALGESALNPEGQQVAVVIAESQKYLRAYGTTPHPNVLAALLMIGLWAALWLYFTYPRRRALALGAYAVMLVGFLLTFSRVAIAVWLAATLLMMIIRRIHWRAMFRPLAVSVLIGATFASVLWPQVRARLALSLEDEAVAQRIFYTRIAGRSASEHLLQGVGMGQFVPRLMEKYPNYATFMYQPAHNVYALVLDELGIPGLAVFLAFLGFIGHAWRKRPYHVMVIGSFLILALFDHYFWTLQQGGFIFWGLLGALSSDIVEGNDQSGYSVPDRV